MFWFTLYKSGALKHICFIHENGNYSLLKILLEYHNLISNCSLNIWTKDFHNTVFKINHNGYSTYNVKAFDFSLFATLYFNMIAPCIIIQNKI